MAKLKLLMSAVAIPLSIGLSAPAVLAATRPPAANQSTKTKTTTTNKPPMHRVRDFEAVVGVFKTRATANKTIAELTSKGLNGFQIESEGRGRFELERTFKTLSAAKAEQASLVKAGFKGASVERS